MKLATRLGAFLLTLALLFALTGCGARQTEAADPPAQDTVSMPSASESAKENGTEELPELSEPSASTKESPVGDSAEDSETLEKQLEEAGAKTAVNISISCAALLAHTDALDEEKAEIIPPDGVLLGATETELREGESVFDLLLRVCRENKLHMEFSETPLYGSAYIEGIGNLYEFDGGEGSGWMYRVNGVFPNVGCSQYILQAGDTVEWLYTCDFGADIGGAGE